MSRCYSAELLMVYIWREGDHLVIKWRTPVPSIWGDVDRRFRRAFESSSAYKHLLRRWHLPLAYERRLGWWLAGVVSADAVRWHRPPTHTEMRREQERLERLERLYGSGVW